MAAKKKSSARRLPIQPVEISLRKRYGPTVAFIGACLVVLGTLGTWWLSAGLPTPAWNTHLRELKAETKIQLDELKADFKATQLKLERTFLRWRIETLEDQERSITWSQWPAARASLAGIVRSLEERQGDQILLSRKSEVENQIRVLEGRAADLRAAIKSLKEQL